MTRTIETVFDGMVFRPLEPVDLAPNTRVRITLAERALTLDSLSAPEKSMHSESVSEEDIERYIYDNYVYSHFNRRERD